jgi:beta-galactosidase
MKKLSICLLLALIYIIPLKAQIKPSNITSFNADWQFVRDIDTVNAAQTLSAGQKDNIKWENISLPHTPRLEPVNKAEEQWQGTCYYRKYFTLAATNKGKHIAIQFDGAMHEADVYLNGNHIYKHLGGYLPLYIDVSNLIRFGKQNCLLVKLNNNNNPLIPPGKPIKGLDFNYYGGLYRNSRLIIQNNLYISDAVDANTTAGGGVLIHNEDVSTKSAKVIVTTVVKNDLDRSQQAKIKITLVDNTGKAVATVLSAMHEVKPNSSETFTQTILVNKPKLWAPLHPYLYHLQLQVLQNGVTMDEQMVKTGIRKIKIDSSGFYLNDEKIVIRGTNRHQEYPYIGYALSDNAQYRDAWKIKQAGFNFVRCSHYPPSPSYLDACDELGIMVMDAIPGWQFFGNAEFQKNSFQNIHDMIHRDRNHAAIVLWEASLNETGMSKAYMDTAAAIVHTELPFKGTYASGWKEYAYDVFIPARQHLKAPDYFKKYNKEKPLLLGEYGDWEYYAQNAGFNQTDYQNLKTEEKTSRQLRGDGQKRLLQQALNFQEAHNDNLYGKIIGDVNWLMFDYKRGYADDLESSGIMDIFRLPKFAYYFYQSQVSATNSKPMLFIANYWNNTDQKAVRIYSNCDKVELFLNGKSLGVQQPDADAISTNLGHPPFTFHPNAYAPGTLMAVGYIGGKKVITSNTTTPGKPYKIVIKTDISGKLYISEKLTTQFRGKLTT